MVNSTRYICSERPKGKSSFVVTDVIKDAFEVQYETKKKERNRRLLLKYQESYGRPVKGRRFKHPSNSLRHEKIMQEIKEEDTRDENHWNKLEVGLITRADKSEKEERSSDDTLWQIRQTIKRKVKISKKETR